MQIYQKWLYFQFKSMVMDALLPGNSSESDYFGYSSSFYGRGATTKLPEFIKVKPLTYSLSHSDGNVSGMTDYFSPNINNLAANCRWISLEGHHVFTNILPEAPKEEKRDEHAIVVDCISPKTLVRQYLSSKVLGVPEDQLIVSTAMVKIYHPFRGSHKARSFFEKQGIYSLSHTQIGVNDLTVMGGGEVKPPELAAHGSGYNRPPELIPTAPAISNFDIFPNALILNLPLAIITLPAFMRNLAYDGFNVRIKLAADSVADLEFLECSEQALIHVTTIKTKDYGHIAITIPDLLNDSSSHAVDALAMVAVFFSRAQHTVHDKVAPGHVQRPEPFYILIGGLDFFTLLGIIVVHDYQINAQHNYLRFLQPQPPNEKLKQYLSKQPDHRVGKRLHKSFDGMRRSHGILFGLNGSSIRCVLSQLIKICEFSAGPIQKKTKNLLEKLGYGQALIAFPEFTKQIIKVYENPAAIQVAGEKTKASSASDIFIGGLIAMDFLRAFFLLGFHAVLHHLGEKIRLLLFCKFIQSYQNLNRM